ncbi:hypothetical protein GCM10027088_53070 [Nocardia goodfellowii]
MSRRGIRRQDGVGEHVVNRLAWVETDALLPRYFQGGQLGYELSDLFELAEWNGHPPPGMSHHLLHVLWALKHHELRTVVAPDTGPVACKVCGLPLHYRGRGRHPEYCGSRCKQTAYRRRRGQLPRPQHMTIDIMHSLFLFELHVLRDSAYRAVDRRWFQLHGELRDIESCESRAAAYGT